MSAPTRNAVLSALAVSATASAVSALVIVMATPEPQVRTRVRPQSTVTDTVKIPVSAPTVTVTATATRTVRVSRSSVRPVRTQRPAKRTAAVNGSPRSVARSMVSASQWPCLDAIVRRESGWNVTAQNPSSGAYGLVQALPGSKMASAGSDWRTNPATQLRWGIRYMDSRYGSPCGALAFHKAHGWY